MPETTAFLNAVVTFTNAAVIFPILRTGQLPPAKRAITQFCQYGVALFSTLYHAAQRDGSVSGRDVGLRGLIDLPDAMVRALLYLDRGFAITSTICMVMLWIREYPEYPLRGARELLRCASKPFPARVGIVGAVAGVLSEILPGKHRPSLYALLHGTWHVCVFVFCGLILPVSPS